MLKMVAVVSTCTPCAVAAAAWLAMGAGGAETAAMARGSRLIAETQASPLQAVIDWFERAHREYQGVVIKELSIPTG